MERRVQKPAPAGRAASSWRGGFHPNLTLSLVLILAAAATLGQDDDAVRFQVTSNLVLVDVGIRDPQGQPVKGLTSADFTVLEGDVRQEIAYFREIDIPLNAAPSHAETTQVAEDKRVPLVSEPLAIPEKRLLILLFNFAGANLQDSRMMRQSALHFLERHHTSQDAVAILAFDEGLELLTDLTSDRVRIAQALGRLSAEDRQQEVSLPDQDESEGTDSLFIADETEFTLFETNRQLSAIEAVADAFRDVPGRKALLYFSTGITSRGIENDQQMRWTTDLCNRANLSIYAVDARGLVALSPGGGAQRAGGGRGIFTGGPDLNQLVALTQSRQGLFTLAEDTGGETLVDDNDLSKIFRRAQQDSSHYYLIGYYVPTPPSDGRFRRIEVQTRIAYSEVRYRKGFYAERPYRSLSSSEREFKLLEAVRAEKVASEFPVEMAAEYFPAASDSYQVPVLLSFDHSQVSRIAGNRDLDLEIVLLARDSQTVTRAGVRDRVQVRARQEDARETRFVYQNLLVLEPGEYQLMALLRDNRSGAFSQSNLSLQIPLTGPILSSSLVVAGQWSEPDTESRFRIKIGKQVTLLRNPLEVGGRVLVPRINGRFTPSETLYVHGKIGVPGEESPGTYRIAILNRNREKIFDGPWTSLQPDQDGLAAVNARLPLNQLEQGSYEIQVQIRLGETPVHQLSGKFELVPADIPSPPV